MSQQPNVLLAVVMQRREIDNFWEHETWEPVEIEHDDGAEESPRRVHDAEGVSRWRFPALRLVLHKDECEGYWQNLISEVPRIFVMWRIEEEIAVPQGVTASYDEASAWMDAGEAAEGLAMPEEMVRWVGDYVKEHFHPEPKRRIRPESFKRPKDRVQS